MISAKVTLLSDPLEPWTEDATNSFECRNFECLWPLVRDHFGQSRTAGIEWYKDKGNPYTWTLVKRDKPAGTMEVYAKW